MHVGARPGPWWDQGEALHRVVSDLVADELVRLRRRGIEQPLPWPPGLSLPADLGIDSLELLSVATSLATTIHLHESGIEDYLLARRRLGDWIDIAREGLRRYSAQLTFLTSGSTGSPVPCAHRLDSLRQESRFLATLVADRRRVLCAVPSHHIYGFLFSVLLPQEPALAGAPVVDIRLSTPAWIARSAQPGDLVVGHPVFWEAVARSMPSLPPDVVGVTSTAPCSDPVVQALEDCGLGSLLQVYGTSQTGGLAWRKSAQSPYELMPHWHRASNGDGLVRTLADGQQESAVAPDLLQWTGPRSLTVLRRHDAAVQVGGINVYPQHVRERLRAHPLVADAEVRLMRPDEGARLKAFVVPVQGVDADKLLTELTQWIDAELPVPQRPKALRIGHQLPRSATGKSTDWEA